jgi:outer membrane protein insertion porin family
MRVRMWSLLVTLLMTHGLAVGQEVPTGQLILKFEGNRVFSEQELVGVTRKCLNQYYQLKTADEAQTLDYCLFRTQQFLVSKGYLQASLSEPTREKDASGLRVTVAITEGPLYRLGSVKIEGSKLFSPVQILDLLTLKTGEVADGESISGWAAGRVAKLYAKFGYVQYSAALKPDFHLISGAREGTVDFTVVIDEGRVFKIRSIKFEGNEDVSKGTLFREMLVQNGEVFNSELFVASLKRIDQTGWFKSIDPDRDVDYAWDKTIPQLDLTIHLKKKA